MIKPRIAVICGPNIDKLPPYLKALEAAGAEGVVFQVGHCTADEILAKTDGVLLPGGGDIDPAFYSNYTHPTVSGIERARDLLEKELVLKLHKSGKPLLGICRGFQVMGWVFGGELYQDIDAEAPPLGTPKNHRQTPNEARNFLAHPIQITAESRLAKILGVTTAKVNSIHHQTLKTVPPPLVASATSPDGLVEVVEDPKHPWFIGVQFHPEEILDQGPWRKLFEDFVIACTPSYRT